MYHGLHVLPASDQCATSALPRRCVESSDTCSCSSTVACRTTFLLNTPVWLCLLVSQRDELPATAGGAAQPSPQGRHLTEANLMSDLQPGRLCEVSPWHEHQQQLWLLQLWRQLLLLFMGCASMNPLMFSCHCLVSQQRVAACPAPVPVVLDVHSPPAWHVLQ